jgi:hypothetical protein
MSYAGLGQTSTAMMPAATVGRDPSRYEAGGAVRVSARWAQRAVNAGNRYNNSFAPLIAVDGRAGSVTISGLRTLSHQFSSDQPVTNNPPTSRVTDTVIIPVALESALATKAFVPDPPLSTATRRTVSSSSSSGTTAATSSPPVTAPIPGVATPSTTASEVILDEGSSGGGGLIARYGLMPWLIGGTAIAGLGIWFLLGSGTAASMRSARPVRANRRRTARNGYRRRSDLKAGRRNYWVVVRSSLNSIGAVPESEMVKFPNYYPRESVLWDGQATGGADAVARAKAARPELFDERGLLRQNRRRRVSRNRPPAGYELVYSTGGHGGPYWSRDSAEQQAEKIMAGGRDQWIAVVPREEIVDLNEAHSVATLRRGLGWLRGKTRLPAARMVRNRITPAQRRRMSKKAFVFPSRRAWPVNNARRAYAAIQFLRMGRVRSASDFNEIRNAVRSRYPRVWAIYGKDLSWERSKAAKTKRASSRRRTSRRGVPRRIAANRRAR